MIQEPSSKFPLSGAVLAGGKAQRFGGQDKTPLTLGPEHLLNRTLAIINSFCTETLISSNTPYEQTKGRIVPDHKNGQGPLGAIYSCLLAACNPYLMIVAGDMPFIRPPALINLWHQKEDFDVIIPRSPDGMQPLAAIYKQSCIPYIATQLKENNFKIRGFFDNVRVKVITCSKFPDIYPDNTFLNINSPDDLKRARSLYLKTN